MTYPAPDIDIQFEPGNYDPSRTDGVEQIADPTMDEVGTTDWDNANGAVLSKVTNGEGGQCLRVTGGVIADPYGFPLAVATTGGTWVRVEIRVRTDGTNNAYIQVDDRGTHTIPAAQTTFDTYILETVLSGADDDIRLGMEGTDDGGYAEFDICSVQQIEQGYTDLSGNGHDYILGAGAGFAATTIPEPLPGKGMGHDGTSEYCSKIADPFENLASFELVHVFRQTANATIYISRSEGTNVVYLFFVTVDSIRFYCGSSSATYAARYLSGNFLNQLLHVRMVHVAPNSATELYVNNELLATAPSALTPTLDSPTRQFQRFGGTITTSSFGGNFFASRLWKAASGRIFTAAQREEEYQEMIHRYGSYRI
jgi:hypothetical protein